MAASQPAIEQEESLQRNKRGQNDLDYTGSQTECGASCIFQS